MTDKKVRGVLFDFLLFERIDQSNCIKFRVKNYIKCERTFEMLTVNFSESTMSRTQAQLWYNRFKEGREDINDNARAGRPNIEAVKKMILANRRITMTEVADDVGISFGSSQAIFMDVIGVKRAVAIIVPKLQNFEQNQRRIGIALEMTAFNDDHNLLKKVITSDESFVYG